MRIGVPKEIKNNENRVALTPEGVERLTRLGHKVVIESNAGIGSGFSDKQYQQAGANIATAKDCWSVELVVKIKEPQPSEYQYFAGQIIFTYFHLSGVSKSLTEALLEKQVTAIAYETLEDEQGHLPALAPMSAVAGNMAVQMGAYYLARFNQGRGVQLATILGKHSGRVLIIGDGIVGQHAAHIASAMGANVIIAGLNEQRFQTLKKQALQNTDFILSTPDNIARVVTDIDLVVGAVLIKGAKAPKVLTEQMVKTMLPGSVIVDVSIDQGGCFETSRPTTHEQPVFIEHGVIHYCVTNMPGAYPRTSTIALTDVTIEYIEILSEQGLEGFCSKPWLARAINIYQGKIVYQKIAEDLMMMDFFRPLEKIL